MLLGITLPTLMATAFELAMLSLSSHPNWREATGRVLFLALAATLFSWFMVSLVKRHQRHLRHQQDKFDALFVNSPEGILIVNQDKQITAMNPKALTMLGYPEKTRSLPLCQVCAPPLGNNCPRDCPFDPTQPRSFFQSHIRHRDGRILAVAAGVSLLPLDDRGETESLIRFSDISLLRAREDAELSRLLARKTLEAQEGERKLLARELHDGLGQSLYALRLAAQTGQPVEPMTLALMEEVSRMAKALWPTALDKLGLCRALQSTLENLEGVEFSVPDRFPRLSQDLEVPLYRITQEAVTNALKHGKAGQVLVKLHRDPSEVVLTVQDDGTGFDLEDNQKRLGLGLASMRERAELARGVCDIHSKPGGGTRVEIRLPLEMP